MLAAASNTQTIARVIRPAYASATSSRAQRKELRGLRGFVLFVPARSAAVTPLSGQGLSVEESGYLNKSSNAWRALDEDPPPDGPEDDLVSRSTVVRGSNSAHSFRVSFGEILARIGLLHSNAALVSKFTHCAHECNALPHFEHVPSALHAVATLSSLPHRTQRTISRNPGMLNVLGAIGGCPRGAYSFLACGRCSRLGSRGSSW